MISKVIPHATKWAVRKRANNRCEDCGTQSDLGFHHIRYEECGHHGPDSIIGRETPDDLLLLCWPCHQDKHRDVSGDYWKDPLAMESYWEGCYGEI